MITEDYISFETAKLLKEKGFDDKNVMPNFGFNVYEPINGRLIHNNPPHAIKSPTLQMAMKWLREVHNIVPVILIGGYTSIPPYYWFRIDKINDGKWEDSVYRDETKRDTYEEACEEAIKYCLKKLI